MKEIFKFLITGILSTFVNYFIFLFLFIAFSIEYVFASATGYICGIFFGFKLNANWTFKFNQNSGDISIFTKYFAVYLFNLVISLILLSYLVEIIKVIPEISNILCIIFTTISNYLLIKFIVFKK